MTVRTRFAPSPTGYMHIGNLRTALYAYLVARKDPDGVFILRIEDTDQGRLVEGATDIIYDTIRACGLKHDEGPDVGGEYGPYVQSERVTSGLYRDYAVRLIKRGGAHYCFCDEEMLQAQREAEGDSFKYDDPCKLLSAEECEKRIAEGAKYVIRQTIPEGQTSFDDEVFGTITVDNSTLDEQVLLKSDGFPTYNFANVIDDHLMGITDVVRGMEYLSSTPKYNLIYNAFDWDIPRYIHCPPVMKDEHSKLSKRNSHFFRACFGFWLNSKANNRLRKFHRFENYWMLRIAKSVAGDGVFQANCCSNISCVNSVDVCSVVGVHLEYAPYALVAVFNGIIDICSSLNMPRIHPKKAKFSNKWICCDFKSQRRKWLRI